MTVQETREGRRVRWGWLLTLGVLGYLVFLIATWPAHHAWGALRGQLGDVPVTLHGVQGSVWAGRAVSAEVQGLRLEQVSWRLLPGGLARGALDASLQFRSVDGPGEALVRVHRNRALQVRDLRARLPMQQVGVLSGAQVRLGGTLALNVPAAEFDPQGRLRSVRGELLWQNATTAMLPAVPLGDVLATLEPQGEVVNVAVRDAGGPVALEGSGRIHADGRYEFRGRMGARESAQPELVGALQLMGRPDREGRVPVAFSGRW